MASPDLRELSDAFVTASRALVGIAIRSIEAAPVEVTLVQHRVLVLLAARGDLGISALAEQLGVNPSNASRVCDRLERLRLVERVPSTDDGRAVCVRLRPEGRAVVDVVTEHRRQEVARILEQLPASQAEQAVRVLQAFSDAAHEQALDAGTRSLE